MKELSRKDCLILSEEETREIANLLHVYVLENKNARISDRRKANDFITNISYIIDL